LGIISLDVKILDIKFDVKTLEEKGVLP